LPGTAVVLVSVFTRAVFLVSVLILVLTSTVFLVSVLILALTFAFSSEGITELECSHNSNLTDIAWFCGNSAKTTHPVAQKKVNAWGLYDMHGNVSELCRNWYGEYPPNQITNPPGPASGIDRIVRGGGWNDHGRHCRSACRGAISSGQSIYNMGFRLVRMP